MTKRISMEISSSISTRLQYQHKSLLDLIDGLTDEQIRQIVIPGKWCIFENIVHLATYQHVFIIRIRQILEGNNPVFPRYSSDADPNFNENCLKTSREVMQDFITTRKEMTAGILLFKDHDFVKTGEHPVFGKMNLIQWLNFFLLHEAHHLFTIFRLGQEIRKANTAS